MSTISERLSELEQEVTEALARLPEHHQGDRGRWGLVVQMCLGVFQFVGERGSPPEPPEVLEGPVPEGEVGPPEPAPAPTTMEELTSDDLIDDFHVSRRSADLLTKDGAQIFRQAAEATDDQETEDDTE